MVKIVNIDRLSVDRFFSIVCGLKLQIYTRLKPTVTISGQGTAPSNYLDPWKFKWQSLFIFNFSVTFACFLVAGLFLLGDFPDLLTFNFSVTFGFCLVALIFFPERLAFKYFLFAYRGVSFTSVNSVFDFSGFSVSLSYLIGSKDVSWLYSSTLISRQGSFSASWLIDSIAFSVWISFSFDFIFSCNTSPTTSAKVHGYLQWSYSVHLGLQPFTKVRSTPWCNPTWRLLVFFRQTLEPIHHLFVLCFLEQI